LGGEQMHIVFPAFTVVPLGHATQLEPEEIWLPVQMQAVCWPLGESPGGQVIQLEPCVTWFPEQALQAL